MSQNHWHVFKRYMLQITIWLILWCITGLIVGHASGGHSWQLIPIMSSILGVIAGFIHAQLMYWIVPLTESNWGRGKKKLPIYIISASVGAVSPLIIILYLILSSNKVEPLMMLILSLMGAASGITATPLASRK